MLVIWKSKTQSKRDSYHSQNKTNFTHQRKKKPKKPRETKNKTTNMELNVWLRNCLLSEWKEIKD